MKIRDIALVAFSLLALAGCATAPETVETTVSVGMSRADLKSNFGEPVRIQPAATGGEDWYYRFAKWKSRPTGESGTKDDFGDRAGYVSVGLQFSKDTEERPIHVSAEGYVIRPVPEGKVVKQ